MTPYIYIYQVSFQCEKSRKFKGFRSLSYLKCSDCCGYFDSNEENSFHYSSDGDLQISVLFKSEENARKFINAMIESCRYFHIPFQHNMASFRNRADLILTPIYYTHYKRISNEGQENSPEYSTAVSSSEISDNMEQCNIEDPFHVLTMIERENLRDFSASAPYKCHLISRKNKQYENNFNNILHLSWLMHDWLDGLNRKRKIGAEKTIPSIKITATGQEEPERKRLRDGSEVDTTKVYIKIFSANVAVVNGLGDMLKEGSFVDTDGCWVTFVNVLDAAIFKHCLETKASQTQALWDENGGCPTA